MIIKICKGKSCSSSGAEYIERRLHADRGFYNYPDEIVVESCGCQNRCEEGPNLLFDGQIETRMNPVKSSEHLRRLIQRAKETHQRNNNDQGKSE